MKTSNINVGMIDRSNLFLEGAKHILESDPSINVNIINNGAGDIKQLVKSDELNVLIIEKEIIDSRNLNIEEYIIKENANMRLVILSGESENCYVVDALKLGVRGYLLKDMGGNDFIEAVKAVHSDSYYVHPRLTHHLVKNY